MAKASGGDFIGELMVSSKVGETISDKVISTLSDADPESIDPVGKINHFKFYPAGGCYQQIDHFRQLLVTGEFKKYDLHDAELN